MKNLFSKAAVFFLLHSSVTLASDAQQYYHDVGSVTTDYSNFGVPETYCQCGNTSHQEKSQDPAKLNVHQKFQKLVSTIWPCDCNNAGKYPFGHSDQSPRFNIFPKDFSQVKIKAFAEKLLQWQAARERVLHQQRCQFGSCENQEGSQSAQPASPEANNPVQTSDQPDNNDSAQQATQKANVPKETSAQPDNIDSARATSQKANVPEETSAQPASQEAHASVQTSAQSGNNGSAQASGAANASASDGEAQAETDTHTTSSGDASAEANAGAGAETSAPVPSGGNSGEATYFEPGLGACGDTHNSSQAIAAVSHYIYGDYANPNESQVCNKCVKVKSDHGSVICQVVDRCPTCEPGSLDLSPTAFQALGELATGRIAITWDWVPCSN